MRRVLLLMVMAAFILPSLGCLEEDELTVVGVMYHHWWVPGRWSDNPRNYAYEPLLGHYDNADPNVIRQHIAWAKQYGINTFVLNFWITDRDWWWVDRNTKAVADICDEEGIDYFFLIDGWFEFKDEADPAYEIAWRVNARAGPYFNRPHYLKQDGKPILFFWAASSADCGLLNAVKSGIEGTMGPIFVTGNSWDCFDMRMMYNSYSPGCAENDYDCQLDHQEDMWSDWTKEREPWAPTAIPGYDDHYVREGNPILTLNKDFFKRSIQAALKYNQRHDDNTKWLFICSWSEWHEGSQIEPSSDFANPYFLLEGLKEELDAHRAGGIETRALER